MHTAGSDTKIWPVISVLMIFINALFFTLASTPAWSAELIHVKVKGLTCNYCAYNVRRQFEGQKAVEKVEISIPEHLLSLTIKEGEQLDDKKIRKLISDAGFKAKTIKREKK